MINGQLELSIANEPGCRFSGRRPRRPRQAQWWFDQMRAAVDRAGEWPPARQAGSERLRQSRAN